MIGRKEKRSAENSPTQTGEIRAFLGEGSRFEGVLVFDDIVRMDGHFQGSITSTDTLIAGHTAQIQADIRVGTLVLSGYFKGTIEGPGTKWSCAHRRLLMARFKPRYWWLKKGLFLTVPLPCHPTLP